MGNLVFQATLGGQVNLVGPNTASTFNLNVPAVSSTIATLTGTETFTNKTLTSPTLTTPVLGTPSSGTLTSCTGLPLTTGVTGTLAVTNGGTGVTTSTGSGNNVLSTSPTLTTPVISSLSSASATALTLQSAGTTALTIDTSQNVGIGTSSPGTQFNVYKSTATTVNIRPQNSLGYADFGPQADGSVYGPYASPAASTQLVVGTSNSNPFTFYTNGNERMRIDSSGAVLIGATATGAYFDGNLNVFKSGSLSATIKTDSSSAYCLATWNSATSGNNLFQVFLTEGTPTVRGNIDYNRGGTAVRYNTTSDYRLKENIADANSALPLLASIKIRSFNWKETGYKVEHGVIAQELEQVAPDAVSVGDSNVNGEIERAWAVDTSVLVPALVKAIQEQQALITAQAETINALTARIVDLEAK